jgi:hypothetical protein
MTMNHEKNDRSKHVPKWQVSPFCNTATVHQGECHICVVHISHSWRHLTVYIVPLQSGGQLLM